MVCFRYITVNILHKDDKTTIIITIIIIIIIIISPPPPPPNSFEVHNSVQH